MNKSIGESPGQIPRLDIRSPERIGFGAVVLFFVFGVGGAAMAPIEKGVGLPGTIIVESKTKLVAHPRGGVIKSVLVSEGQQVRAGELLATFDIDALNLQLGALKTQLAAAERQLSLARQESETVDILEQQKLAAKSKALALQRGVAEIEKDVAGFAVRIAAVEDERAKSEIRAPVSGRVLSLQVHANGAVVQPGATIAEIVPEDDDLVIEGRLQPNQIENVRPGMPAKVWLTALSWREQRPMPASLTWISADSIEDKRTGQPYFVVRVGLDKTSPEAAKPAVLQAGMRAEILLLTGQRTLLDQLIDPLTRNIHKAFKG